MDSKIKEIAVKTKELQESFASLEKKYKEVRESKADHTLTYQDLDNLYSSMMSNLNYRLSYLSDSINYIADSLYDHKTKGHLPPIQGSEKMENALDTLGLSKDYDVIRPAIYASKTRRGVEIIATYKKSK